LIGVWVEPDLRDQVVDFVEKWTEKTEISTERLIGWLKIGAGKFYAWRQRYGLPNQNNGKVPREHWLADEEKTAIIEFHKKYPLEGYRRLTYMMMDADVAAVSPASVWRVLSGAGLLQRFPRKPTKRGTGFEQPLQSHEHWHIDIAHINIHGTFYYLCAILDGRSRYLVHWDLRDRMTEGDVEVILQRARELFPEARPRVISDNGPQFIAKDFKEMIRLSGMTHVRTAPYYPQSNGKMERWNQSVKAECIRPGVPLTLEDARRIIAQYVEFYNNVRLHSAIGYVAPQDMLWNRRAEIHAERDRKLAEARQRRALALRNKSKSDLQQQAA
jgi:transposase InsO family protein